MSNTDDEAAFLADMLALYRAAGPAEARDVLLALDEARRLGGDAVSMRLSVRAALPTGAKALYADLALSPERCFDLLDLPSKLAGE